ncbi:MAG: YbaB/EbfC family nucleoid-associated protein [Pseudomonadota bacterium]
MKDLAKIMRQAQEMQSKMADVQQKMELIEAEGAAGAGLVKVTLRGKGELVSCTIDPGLMGDEAEIVEDLIKAAHGDARKRLDEEMQKTMQEVTKDLGGGMLPGFKLPF